MFPLIRGCKSWAARVQCPLDELYEHTEHFVQRAKLAYELSSKRVRVESSRVEEKSRRVEEKSRRSRGEFEESSRRVRGSNEHDTV